MILPCEVSVKTVLPAVKAIMARSIVEKHGYTEKQTAILLGLSQSAVSRYVSRERGANLATIENIFDITSIIDEMVIVIIQEPQDRVKLLHLFCKTCTTIREKGLICPKCQSEMQREWAETCLFCRE